MKRKLSIFCGMATLLFLLLLNPSSEALQNGQPAVSASTESIVLTIYQGQDLALIEDERVLELESGLKEYRLEGVSARLLPESVQLKALETPEAVVLIEQRFENKPISLAQLLKSHLGKEIEVFASGAEGKTYKGQLLGTEGGIILREETGQLRVISDAIRFGFPPQEPSKPALLWTLQSEFAGPQKVRLSYLSEGLNWQAHYTAVLNPERNQLDLESWVSITNESGMSFEQAQLKLVAGQIHRVREARKGLVLPAALAPPAYEEQPSFEYHLYTLGRPATLRDGETVRQAFLPPASFPTEVRYIYEAYAWDGVQVWVEFTSGEKPLPAGILQLYQQTPQGELQLIGEDRLRHTPAGERVRLLTGLAFDLVVKRLQTGHERLGDNRWRDSFQITLTNHKSEGVVIQVRERMRGDWKITSSKPDFIKLDAQTIEFRVSVAPGQSAVVEYTVEYTLE